jgi:hypothetical protein
MSSINLQERRYPRAFLLLAGLHRISSKKYPFYFEYHRFLGRETEKSTMDQPAAELPPEAIAFAARMYNAARAGQMDIFEQALPAGLPANMTNEKGDSLVGFLLSLFLQSKKCILLFLLYRFAFYFQYIFDARYIYATLACRPPHPFPGTSVRAPG